MARKLINTKKISHEEWLALRKKSIGGSDAGTCVGMNQYSSLITLYADKMGLSKDKETSEAMRLGTDLEEYVAKRFCEQEGKKVINDTFMYMDDEYDFITANIDRKVVGENAGLECKTMGSQGGYNFSKGDIPAHYFCQCQHYMMVRGFDYMYLAILVLQRGLFVIKVKRDDEFIKKLREAEIHFWTHYIEKEIVPEPDGSEASMETLKILYAEPIPKSEIRIFGLDKMVRDYKAMKAVADEYAEYAETAKQKIRKIIGDNEVGLGDDFGVSCKKQSRSFVSPTKLKAKYPKIYEELVEVSTFRRFDIRNLTKKEK